MTASESRVADAAREVDVVEYLGLAAGVVLGVLANAVVLIAALDVSTGTPIQTVGGVAYLMVGLILAVWLYHYYDPLDLPYIRGAVLFLTVALANTVSLLVRIFRTAPQSEPMAAVIILGFVALLFTPGPFLATWVVRRWYL